MALRRPETLTTAVATYIKDAIVRGEFAPGSRLPEVAAGGRPRHVARGRSARRCGRWSTAA